MLRNDKGRKLLRMHQLVKQNLLPLKAIVGFPIKANTT